ncbi:hypothetical protein [Serratia quinivorans]|jgi:uncharacterized membrane-anchored protein|uniref:COG4705 family protein n=1 Tax=Serratia quinivorans TaxID=137545 RepID=UPI002178F7FE|nr:hypothetical protein [Serratia quinivorans]CAI0696692.1 Uncharacterized membrane-anchored protein conserved in bacteria [Serratia quinivorans]CAI0703312.1 Uncharacterized membrane-anchored protein conserved in bacteria [Serratia quinivorans]CAI0929940.1 Uncharacterized membrane-anchored protein conserved in bacteria [Serratia quinivorans]CAI2025875.1 Uncharacterized membrane-anchored protein conserved in bacteria [Serratia quinivorans]
MSLATERPAINWLNKVPEVTLFFWLIKMMSTTVGETAADYLNMDLNFGLTNTSLITGGLLLVALFFQIRARRYVPVLYWIAVVLISVFGTLITDNLTDHFGISLAFSTALFSVMLVATFMVWYNAEHTLSIHAIDTPKRELFYWAAILFTFALGTAAGDWVAEGLQLGYGYSTLLFGALIGVTAIAHYLFKANSVLCFWIAYVLTRPLGASCGDLLSQPAGNGGMGLGAAGTSGLFLVAIISLVTYLTLMQKRLQD